jgi:hypothetical protein
MFIYDIDRFYESRILAKKNRVTFGFTLAF